MASPRVLFEIQDDRNTSAIATGDVTGSGGPELCTGGRDGVIKLYNAARNEIRLLAQLDVTGSILAIRIADANNDGQMEIVVGRSVGLGENPGRAGTLQIYRYASSGKLELLAEQPIDKFVTSVYVTDVTGDGKNEILAGGSDSTLRVISLDTDNNISEIVRYELEDMPLSIGTCDVDGDEIEEIVIGNRDNTLRVFKLHDHRVEEVEVLKLPSPVISIAAGDILGDRKMELGVVTYDGSIRIYRNEESRLDLFSTLPNVKALSIRIAELNADHMDEIVVATSDYKITFYSLYMAELRQLASVNLGSKILSLAVGDTQGNGRKEVLAGVSGGPLKVIEGLYQLIPSFDVEPVAETGAGLTGTLKLTNITESPVTGVTGKLYWFPKNHMDVEPQQIRMDVGPRETKTVAIRLNPRIEGTVIVRPIVLMWTDIDGQVKQVTTPETAILVQRGRATAAPAADSPVVMRSIPQPVVDTVIDDTAPTIAPVEGTGFGAIDKSAVTAEESEVPVISEESLKAAEAMLDKLFGEDSAPTPDSQAFEDIKKLLAEPEPAPVATVRKTVSPPQVAAVVSTESAIVSQIRSRTPKPPKPGSGADAYSYLFKTMVIGEGAVGKTTLVNRYVTGIFERDYKTTIGSQFAVKLALISPEDSEYGVGIKIQAWDVAGQARFAAVRKMYYSGAAGVIIVFDVTRRRSFTELTKWVQEADESIGGRVPVVCVGNKVDLPDRAVTSEEAKSWSEQNGFTYMESSAKTGEGVADMFSVLAELMYREARKATEDKKRKR